jgi:hypothetical protein
MALCFLELLKNDVGEVDDAMFEGDERPCELIFSILGIEISEMDEVADVMFHLGEWL